METSLELELLQKFVAMPTVTGNFVANNQALNFIEAFLRKRGMHIARREYDGYGALVATTRPTKTPEIMLAAHVDVVPAPQELFELHEVQGMLQGRGAWDMKFAIAAYLALVDVLQHNLTAYDFGIMIVTDEETVDYSTGGLLRDGFRPKAAILLDGADNLQVESVAKGACYVEVTLQGRTAHGSRPWLGDSVSMKLLDLLAEIRLLFDPAKHEADTLNISVIHCGQVPNQVPDFAQVTLDIRSANQTSQERIKGAIFALCDKYGAKTEVKTFFPPLKHDLKNPYFSNFIASIEKITHRTHVSMLSYGASSAVHFQALDIPCIVTQPMGGDRHGPNEWIDIASFLQLLPILQDYIERVSKIPEA